jgi:hypothetical protein
MPKISPRPQPPGGSRKGRPNKISKIIKIEVLESFRMVGGRHYLARQAEENPTAYMNLLGKVIPQQIESAVGDLKIVVQALTGPVVPVRGVLNSPVAGHIWREPEQPIAIETDSTPGKRPA